MGGRRTHPPAPPRPPRPPEAPPGRRPFAGPGSARPSRLRSWPPPARGPSSRPASSLGPKRLSSLREGKELFAGAKCFGEGGNRGRGGARYVCRAGRYLCAEERRRQSAGSPVKSHSREQVCRTKSAVFGRVETGGEGGALWAIGGQAYLPPYCVISRVSLRIAFFFPQHTVGRQVCPTKSAGGGEGGHGAGQSLEWWPIGEAWW